MFDGDDRDWFERWRRWLQRRSGELWRSLRAHLRRVGLAAIDGDDARAWRSVSDALDETGRHARGTADDMAGMTLDAARRFDGRELPIDGERRVWTAPPRREFLEAMSERIEPRIIERYPLVESAVVRTILTARQIAASAARDMPLADEADLRIEIEGRVVNNARLHARIIAETETHAVAMQAQAEAVDELGLPVKWKTWWATNDLRTRPTHRVAHRQRRRIDQPFTVGQYSLMIPGDSSLGAGLEEIINCRCGVVYEVEE